MLWLLGIRPNHSATCTLVSLKDLALIGYTMKRVKIPYVHYDVSSFLTYWKDEGWSFLHSAHFPEDFKNKKLENRTHIKKVMAKNVVLAISFLLDDSPGELWSHIDTSWGVITPQHLVSCHHTSSSDISPQPGLFPSLHTYYVAPKNPVWLIPLMPHHCGWLCVQ